MILQRTEAAARRRRRTLWAVALVGYSVLLTAASLAPVGKQSPLAATESGRTLSNLLHVPAYAVLTWLWVGALRAAGRGAVLSVALGAAVALGYGALMELAQSFVPGRGGSAADLMRNALGTGLACIVLPALRLLKGSPQRKGGP